MTEKISSLSLRAIKANLMIFFSLRAIKACSTRDSLENEFKKYKMSMEQRIDLLLRAMGNPAVSYSCGCPKIEDRYEILLNSFLAGIWKKNYSSLKARGKLEAL